MAKDGPLNRFCAITERTQIWFLSFALAILFIDLLFQILSRVVLRTSMVWTEEISRLSMIWIVFLGAAVSIRKGAHFSVDFIVKLLPRKSQRVVRILVFIGVLAVSAIFLAQGAAFARMGLDVVSPTLDVRMIWSYLAVPVGGTFMVLYSLEALLEILRGEVWK